MDDFVKKTVVCERNYTKPEAEDKKTGMKQMSITNYVVNSRSLVNRDQLSWMDDSEGDEILSKISSQEIQQGTSKTSEGDEILSKISSQEIQQGTSKTCWRRKLEEDFEQLEKDVMMEGVSDWSDFSESDAGARQFEDLPEEFFDEWDDLTEKTKAVVADDPGVM